MPHPPDRARGARERRARHGGRAAAAAVVAPARVGGRGIQRVYLRCASSGDLSLFGKGAGALPAATAVLGDLIDLAQDNSVALAGAASAAAGARRPATRAARRGGTICASSGSRIPASSAGSRAWCGRSGLTVQNRAARGERCAGASGIHDFAELRRADRGRAAPPSRASRASGMPVPGSARVSGSRPQWLDPAGCPAERPPLSACPTRPGAARRARRPCTPHRTAVPASRRAHRAARSVRLGARDRVAGSERPHSCSRAKDAGPSCRTSMRATARPRRPR